MRRHDEKRPGLERPVIHGDGTLWYVRRDVPNWERCQDGTAFTGSRPSLSIQLIPKGLVNTTWVPVMAGKDKTLGPSGACGQNQWLLSRLPLRLDKIG